MKKLVLLLLILVTTSCTVLRNQTRITFINATIFQVIDSNTALALDQNTFEVIKVVTAEEIYFDGRPIIGLFVLVDTYAYNATVGKYKVVPVFVRYSEYRKYRIPY